MSDLESKVTSSKVALVDTGGNITYSLLVGAMLDYSAGLSITGILASRTYATGMNAITAAPYGWWREKAFTTTKTTEEHGRLRKTAVDLLAFNTFQTPVYASAVAVGSFLSEGEVDMEKVQNGTLYLTTISPLIGPTMGWYMDKFRKVFGVQSAAEGAYK